MNITQINRLGKALDWVVKNSNHKSLPIVTKAFNDGDLEFMHTVLEATLISAKLDGRYDDDIQALDYLYACFHVETRTIF